MISIPNSKRPKACFRVPVAPFRLDLYRDGDRLVLDAAHPKCYRDFHSFTGAEKDAYNNILRLIIEQGVEAMNRTADDAKARAER